MIKRIGWIVLLIATGISLMGCFSNEKAEKEIGAPTLKTVSLQLQWVTQAQFAGYYVALEKGWYREAGIDLTIKPGGPDIVPVDTVASGTADFGTTLLADLAVAIEKSKPVISIGQIQQKNGLVLVTRKSSKINHPKDFVGRQVGVWLGSWEAQFNALLSRENVDANDVKVLSQGWSMKPFIKNELEVASAMVYNEYLMVLASGIRQDELNVIDYADFDLAFPGDVLFTSTKMIEADPDLCTRMLRSSLRGWEYAMDHPEEAAAIVLKHDQSGVQTKEHQLAMMKEITKLIRIPGRRTGNINDATLTRMVEHLLKYKIISTEIQPGDIFTRGFLDKALLS